LAPLAAIQKRSWTSKNGHLLENQKLNSLRSEASITARADCGPGVEHSMDRENTEIRQMPPYVTARAKRRASQKKPCSAAVPMEHSRKV
jgi:hypothetical protein